jgi:hypothetical protein
MRMKTHEVPLLDELVEGQRGFFTDRDKVIDFAEHYDDADIALGGLPMNVRHQQLAKAAFEDSEVVVDKLIRNGVRTDAEIRFRTPTPNRPSNKRTSEIVGWEMLRLPGEAEVRPHNTDALLLAENGRLVYSSFRKMVPPKKWRTQPVALYTRTRPLYSKDGIKMPLPEEAYGPISPHLVRVALANLLLYHEVA